MKTLREIGMIRLITAFQAFVTSFSAAQVAVDPTPQAIGTCVFCSSAFLIMLSDQPKT